MIASCAIVVNEENIDAERLVSRVRLGGVTGLDHQRIRHEEDRSFTLALLDSVRDERTDSEEWTEALTSLRLLQDYRSVAPLRAFLEDRSKAPQARRAVGQALDAFDLPASPEVWRRWWTDGDEVLQRHALGYMDRSDASLVSTIATESGHPMRSLALSALEFGFEESKYQAIKVAALSANESEVRRAASYAIVWDEPLTAEPALQHLLVDPSLDIARNAAYALQYYVSLATLHYLRQASGVVDPELEAQRAESEETIADRITGELDSLNEEARTWLVSWMDAVTFVAKRLDLAMLKERAKGPVSFDPVADPAAFAEALDTSTGSFSAKAQQLRAIDWEAVSTAYRDRMGHQFVSHADPEVRMIATTPLQMWNRTDDLLKLLDDEHFGVAKSAMYSLRFVVPDGRVANAARSAVHVRGGTHALEALDTFAAHATREDALGELVLLASTDPRQDIRGRAIYALSALDAHDELDALMGQLADAPMVNWALHVALLLCDNRHRADVDVLRSLVTVDNIDIAAAAARALAARGVTHPG